MNSTVRSVSRVDVYKQARRAGELTRTTHGATFVYDSDYAAQAPTESVAFAMPVRNQPYEIIGTNLHPFFAGLLPEGIRLRALVRAVKTSEDDLFSLLVAAGGDTIGDVAIAESGALPTARSPIADVNKLSDVSFSELLEESLRYDLGKGDVALSGAQPKVSAAMISFPLRARHRHRKDYILKLNPPDHPRLVENEAFFMQMAKRVGFQVAKTKLVTDREGTPGLLVERFDRHATPHSQEVSRVHQEDACQLLERYPADKYRLTLRDVSDALEICSAPVAERLKLICMQAFAYVIVNGDMHAKNISVRVVGSRVELTPCYDVLSTLPYGDRKLALSLDGRDDRLSRKHFVSFAERIGVRRVAIEKMLDALVRKVGVELPRLGNIGLPPKQTKHVETVVRERIGLLQ